MTDAEVVAELHAAVAAERVSIRRVLAALMPFDGRGLAMTLGYATTFEYCVKALGYAGHGAYKRISVSRMARTRPEVLDKIESGKLSLSAAAAISHHAEKKECDSLLKAAEGKTCREVEEMVAKLNPVAEAPRDTVTTLALVASEPQAEPKLAYRVSITLSDEGYEKLERATDLLRHKHPKGEPHSIVEDALEALLEAVDRSRNDAPAKPRAQVVLGGRYIPQWVRDLVWKRDGGRCAFVARGGRRCEATAFLQFDHAKPFALGGASNDPGNIRLLCAAHNRLAAREAGISVDRASRGE